MSNAAKSFNILAINLIVLHNYFNDLIKLFPDLYLAKLLDKLLIRQNRSFREGSANKLSKRIKS